MDETFIVERLIKLRMANGASARDMSLSMGQSSNFIHYIESGKSSPSMESFFAICEYLKIAPKEFFDDGNTNPALLNELIEELKPLDSAALSHILGLVRVLRGKV